MLDRDYLAFRKRLEIELQSEFRVRMIVKTVLDYYKYPKKYVFGPKATNNVAFIRYTIFYLCHSIYGIDCRFIGRMLKFSRQHVWVGNERIREQLGDLKINTDIHNLRQVLVKVLNA